MPSTILNESKSAFDVAAMERDSRTAPTFPHAKLLRSLLDGRTYRGTPSDKRRAGLAAAGRRSRRIDSSAPKTRSALSALADNCCASAVGVEDPGACLLDDTTLGLAGAVECGSGAVQSAPDGPRAVVHLGGSNPHIPRRQTAAGCPPSVAIASSFSFSMASLVRLACEA